MRKKITHKKYTHFALFLNDAITEAQWAWEDGRLRGEGDCMEHDGYALEFVDVVGGDAVKFRVVFDEGSWVYGIPEFPDYAREAKAHNFTIAFGRDAVSAAYQ